MQAKTILKDFPKLLKKTGINWIDSSPFELSAIVAYYAILSLPALIVIILNLVGNIWGREIVQGELLDEITKAVGIQTAESIRVMMLDRGDESVSIFTTIIGVGTLIYGATGVFYQLQAAFDKIWKVKENPKTNEFLKIIFDRLKSFGFILIIGFLLLISFILTALISSFSRRIEKFVPDNLFEYIYVVDFLMSILFIYILFAAMFKYLPSKKVRWRAVKVGAALTAILFVIGKYVLAWYFSEMEPASTYGAAGSVILIMLWVSYSSLILFFGAHFTKVYADMYLNNKDEEIVTL
ncbi:YihY/virulence factor BrkB family protein [Polaribacter batillariae]|uniref:YihY/virulence factor BrkB family protein n=1 Tax=Polaribacter batillariae TaxID=2808900 RepID=A0ABX7SW61_9FLAO|nr:YihY/virulence factor BrkB family protein [Polaribacter batillariae]QTD37894.1 YihY/virulence factor BrkB family protein [Polaribacter batillariae]